MCAPLQAYENRAMVMFKLLNFACIVYTHKSIFLL